MTLKNNLTITLIIGLHTEKGSPLKFFNNFQYYCVCLITKKGANVNNRTMEYGWRQNEGYVGGATC